MRDQALSKAIEAAGGITALASAIGISRAAVSQWCRVPAERVIAVERAVGGKVSRGELRPDLYPAVDASLIHQPADTACDVAHTTEQVAA